MATAQYVIIGAGFAGAATAYHLARSGADNIVLVEQEELAGVHSSGRNASMIRQVVPNPYVGALAREGAAFIRHLPEDWPLPVKFEQNGSLLLGRNRELENLTRDACESQEQGVEVECWSKAKAEEHVEVLKTADFDGAVWCPTDGVVDIHALLSGYLKAATFLGTVIRYRSPVREILIEEGRVGGIRVGTEMIETDAVINAAGPWAGAIAEMAGGVKAPLHPCRRHLFVTPHLPWVDRRWPFVWDVSHDLYFRPEQDGLLLCACDQEEVSPCLPVTDESVTERLAEKMKQYLPALSNVPIKTNWAGLRTLCEDGRFVIGWDPKIKGFFWVAGLGGHGVTTSSAVGALAARLILGKGEQRGNEFSPDRFLATSKASPG